MTSLGLQIAGLGRYLPRRIVSAADIESAASLPEGWVAKKTGVLERRWVDGETLLEMAAAASHEAVAAAEIDLDAIDLIMFASATPYQAIPDTASLLQRELGLGSSGIQSFTVHSTCLSFLTALDLASAQLFVGRHKRILIVSADIASIAIDMTEPESAALLGDMAVAAVVTAPPEGSSSAIHSFVFQTFGEGADLCEVRGGGVRKHPNDPSTKPEDYLFHMDGPQVMDLALRCFPQVFGRAIVEAGLTFDAIDLVVPHQASLKAITLLQMALGFPAEKVMINLDRYGNCVAASLPGALYDAVESGRLKRGDTVVLAGSGAGVSFAAAALTW